MARWPNPTYNKLIETDPQIVKVSLDYFSWGSRPSMFAQLNGNAKGDTPGKPGGGGEMTIKHTK